MRFNELTIFNPTIPTCVSLRDHRTSQMIPRKDLQKEVNDEFELITVKISLAASENFFGDQAEISNQAS